MKRIERLHPEIKEYLDHTDEYENTGTEFKQGNERYLIVTQKGADGQQLLFRWNGKRFEYRDNDTIINTQNWSSLPDTRPDPRLANCGPSTTADHTTVYRYALTQVDVFDSSAGPDGGNLAFAALKERNTDMWEYWARAMEIRG